VSCAAAVAVNEVMVETNILDNVQTRSIELFSALNALKYDPSLNPHIIDVRGRGLMVGIEFASPTSSSHAFSTHSAASLPPPSATPHHSPHSANTHHHGNHPENMAARVARKCIEKGMLILTTSVYEVVRFIPPLNVSKEDMKKGCGIFAESVREVVKEG
jgi:4-aminobutyrate aminotransferase